MGERLSASAGRSSGFGRRVRRVLPVFRLSRVSRKILLAALLPVTASFVCGVMMLVAIEMAERQERRDVESVIAKLVADLARSEFVPARHVGPRGDAGGDTGRVIRMAGDVLGVLAPTAFGGDTVTVCMYGAHGGLLLGDDPHAVDRESAGLRPWQRSIRDRNETKPMPDLHRMAEGQSRFVLAMAGFNVQGGVARPSVKYRLASAVAIAGISPAVRRSGLEMDVNAPMPDRTGDSSVLAALAGAHPVANIPVTEWGHAPVWWGDRQSPGAARPAGPGIGAGLPTGTMRWQGPGGVGSGLKQATLVIAPENMPVTENVPCPTYHGGALKLLENLDDGEATNVLGVKKENLSMVFSDIRSIDNEFFGSVWLISENGHVQKMSHEFWMQFYVLAFFPLLVVSGACALYLGRSITGPVAGLASTARAIQRESSRERRVDAIGAKRFGAVTQRGDEVGMLARSLSDMTEELVGRMTRMRAFGTSVGHDLLASMQAMEHQLKRIDRCLKEKRYDRVEDSMEIARKIFSNVTEKVWAIKEYSTYDDELEKTRLVEMPLLDWMQEYQLQMKDSEDIGFVLERTAGVADVKFASSRVHLEKAFNEILRNAKSFTPTGGSIRVRLSMEQEFVRFDFDNDGPGIPEEALETIFAIYKSVRPAEDGPSTSAHNGVGLFHCRTIVECLGGRVHAENRMCDGTVTGARFVVLHPRTPD